MRAFTDFSSTTFLNLRRLIVAAAAVAATAPVGHAAEQALSEIKGYLVGKVQLMNTAASDFVRNASAYQAIIDSAGGDYNKAAIEHGPEIMKLLAKMQDNYRGFHNKGYENIEGIVAGTKTFVDFDVYMDAGVPKAEASTDSPVFSASFEGCERPALSATAAVIFFTT